MRAVLFIVMFMLGAAPALHAASPSDRFWDPFRGAGGSLADEVRILLEGVRAEVDALAGRTVSLFRIPDQNRIGFREASRYVQAFLGFRSRTEDPPSPPSPRPGDQSQHDSPAWAADCSCRRGDPCPDNPNQQCEDCRAITRGPSTITTPEDCRVRSHVEDFDVD